MSLVHKVMEVVGYCIRVASHYKPFNVVFYVVQYFLIASQSTKSYELLGLTSSPGQVVAPITFSAALYLALSIAIRRLPWGMGHGLLSFSPRILVGAFVILDIATTVIQIT